MKLLTCPAVKAGTAPYRESPPGHTCKIAWPKTARYLSLTPILIIVETQARIESARIIRSFIIKHAADAPSNTLPVDFNSHPTPNITISTLMDEGERLITGGECEMLMLDIYRRQTQKPTQLRHSPMATKISQHLLASIGYCMPPPGATNP